jgi:hypothetical protein
MTWRQCAGGGGAAGRAAPLAQSSTEVLDEVVQLFDQAVSSRESKAAHKMRDALAERGKAGEDPAGAAG